MLAALLALALAATPSGDVAPAPSSAASTPALPPEDVVRRLRAARLAGMKGDLARQRQLLNEAVAAFPGAPDPLWSLLLFNREHPPGEAEREEVRALLRPVIASNPRSVPFGLLALIADDPHAAPADLELVRAALAATLERTPDDVRALRGLLALQLRGQQLDEARRTALHLFELTGEPGIRSILIGIDAASAHWQDVLDEVEAQRVAAPEAVPVPAYLLGLAALGRMTELNVVLSDPENKVAVYSLKLELLVRTALAAFDAGHPDESRRLLELANRTYPGQHVDRLLVGLFGTEEEWARAETAGKADDEKLHGRELINAASMRLTAGDAETAFTLLDRATAENPAAIAAWFNLGIAAGRLKRWDRMETAYDHALQLKPDWPEALLGRAEARTRLQHWEAALADLDRVQQLKPDQRNTFVFYIDCYKGLNRMKEAEAAYKRYKELGGT